MLSQKIRLLREQNGLKQREVAAKLEVDTAYISKMENGEKPIRKDYIPTLANLFKVSQNELLLLWLSDKIYDVIDDEELAEKCLKFTLKRLKTN